MRLLHCHHCSTRTGPDTELGLTQSQFKELSICVAHILTKITELPYIFTRPALQEVAKIRSELIKRKPIKYVIKTSNIHTYVHLYGFTQFKIDRRISTQILLLHIKNKKLFVCETRF